MLLDLLLSRPVLTSENAAEATGASSSAVSVALNRLFAAGVQRPLTDRKRDQVWGAAAVLDELEALNVRIAARPAWTSPTLTPAREPLYRQWYQ